MKLNRLDWPLLLLGEHCYLDSSDECYFVSMYECSHYPQIKPLITSLKQGHSAAIAEAANRLASVLPPDWTGQYTFVPMPSSSGKRNPIRKVLHGMPDVSDIRDLIIQKQDTPTSHAGWRPLPAQRAALFSLNEKVTRPEPTGIVIVDDVVTTGSHFRAVKLLIRTKWSDMRVIGVFLARVCSRWHNSCYLEESANSGGQICGKIDVRPTVAMRPLPVAVSVSDNHARAGLQVRRCA